MHLRRVLRNVKVICRRELELAVNPCVICSAKTFYNLVRKKEKGSPEIDGFYLFGLRRPRTGDHGVIGKLILIE